MQAVSFTRMKDGTREDYQFLRQLELDYIAKLADRLLQDLEQERDSLDGYQVTRYEHSLQTATRAARAGESEEYVVAALFHDIGDRLAPDRHGEMAAAVLEPYVSDEIAWIVRQHGLFQAYYFATISGRTGTRGTGTPGTPTTRPACGSARSTTRPPSTPVTAVSRSASSDQWCAASYRSTGAGHPASDHALALR